MVKEKGFRYYLVLTMVEVFIIVCAVIIGNFVKLNDKYSLWMAIIGIGIAIFFKANMEKINL